MVVHGGAASAAEPWVIVIIKRNPTGWWGGIEGC